jgi:hypothetical protein
MADDMKVGPGAGTDLPTNALAGVAERSENIARVMLPQGTRVRLPNRRESETAELFHLNQRYVVTVSRLSDGSLAEIFLSTAKPNSELATHANDAAVLASMLLQHGVSAANIRRSLAGPLAAAIALFDDGGAA